MLERVSTWIFRHRLPLVGFFVVVTVIMAVFASRLRVDASFNKSLPLDHPYIRTFTKYQSEFGGANRVLIALMVKNGDIFTPDFFAQLRKVTDETTFLPAVDRAQVQSLFTPNVRYIEVVEDGFAGGNVLPADFTPTPANFAKVRENILKSGKLGQLVANDFSGAIVSAQLLEIDPATGRKIDYARVAAGLEAIRQRVEKESDGAITVHIIGFAKVIGDISDGARGVLLLFGVSIIITALLVWHYAGRWKLAAAPVICSLVAVVWQLGGLTALGYGVDPFSILVPFLVFAIGVSHGVQKISMFRNEMFKGHDGPTAARSAFMQLIVPGVQSVISLPSMAKLVNAGYSEGSLKWRILPRNASALAQAVSPIETATGLLNGDASVMPILIFLTDHKAETLHAVTDAVKAFAAAHPSPKAKFLLASGNAGVMAATNEVVAAAQLPILLWVFGAVITLCLITFRSIRATLCIVVPLAIVSWLAYALMVYLGIGLKISTLPVVALGVGIGVDYGIYLFASLQSSLRRGEFLEDAMFQAFKDTGAAIVFTGLTLGAGVSMWIFSDLKFQADMGLLLTFMFLVNMLGAIVLLPAMARWLFHHHSRKE